MRIAVAQKKGGVAKTASARELAVTLHSMGHSVLVVDCDDQHNITDHLRVEPKTTLSDLLMSGENASSESIVTSPFGPDVLAADSNLVKMEAGMAVQPDNREILTEILSDVDYDFILLDCPPSLGLLTINAIHAADCILAPLAPDGMDSIGGLMQLLGTLNKARRQNMPIFTIHTRWNYQTNLANDVDVELERLQLEDLGTVKETVRVGESVTAGPISWRLPDNDAALGYRRIAEQLVKKAAEVPTWPALR